MGKQDHIEGGISSWRKRRHFYPGAVCAQGIYKLSGGTARPRIYSVTCPRTSSSELVLRKMNRPGALSGSINPGVPRDNAAETLTNVNKIELAPI